MSYKPKYKIGQYYRTLEGKTVKIINESRVPNYECVKGDDGVWRYDREGRYEDGRVTGTMTYPPDPRNFSDGSWLKNPIDVIDTFKSVNMKHIGESNARLALELACKRIDDLISSINTRSKRADY